MTNLNTELFAEISESQQEVVAGGFNLGAISDVSSTFQGLTGGTGSGTANGAGGNASIGLSAGAGVNSLLSRKDTFDVKI